MPLAGTLGRGTRTLPPHLIYPLALCYNFRASYLNNFVQHSIEWQRLAISIPQLLSNFMFYLTYIDICQYM